MQFPCAYPCKLPFNVHAPKCTFQDRHGQRCRQRLVVPECCTGWRRHGLIAAVDSCSTRLQIGRRTRQRQNSGRLLQELTAPGIQRARGVQKHRLTGPKLKAFGKGVQGPRVVAAVQGRFAAWPATSGSLPTSWMEQSIDTITQHRGATAPPRTSLRRLGTGRLAPTACGSSQCVLRYQLLERAE